MGHNLEWTHLTGSDEVGLVQKNAIGVGYLHAHIVARLYSTHKKAKTAIGNWIGLGDLWD